MKTDPKIAAAYDEQLESLLAAMNADAEQNPAAPRSADDEDWSNGGLATIVTPEFLAEELDAIADEKAKFLRSERP